VRAEVERGFLIVPRTRMRLYSCTVIGGVGGLAAEPGFERVAPRRPGQLGRKVLITAG